VDIGIGLPTYMRGISLDTTLEWARRAEAHRFASVGTLDRLVYANCDPLITLSAAAAVTRSVRLITTIVITPYRNTAVLAKEAASLDSLSEGRLVLGVGLGGRAEDYTAAGAETRRRGSQLANQLDELKRIWAGEKRGFAGGIGPAPVQPSGPQLLVGGDSPAALRRMAGYADGWVARAGAPGAFAEQYPGVLSAWRVAGRAGKPRTVALAAFGRGPTAREEARRILGDYYAYAGAHAERIAASALVTVEGIREALAGFASAGCDELVMFPALPDPGQVDLLAEAVKALPANNALLTSIGR
jgi:alkanesulfonate monooxygenase SsuD/methylene tetrahydromethanopterin reductase-like flavin-dependent oxidoreductase (luciferase family)